MPLDDTELKGLIEAREGFRGLQGKPLRASANKPTR